VTLVRLAQPVRQLVADHEALVDDIAAGHDRDDGVFVQVAVG
jgi:hypothetical protein